MSNLEFFTAGLFVGLGFYVSKLLFTVTLTGVFIALQG